MSPPRPVRVTFVVPDLGIGGAERHVTTLVSRLDQRLVDPSVICLGREGELFPSLAASGVPAVALDRTKREAPQCLAELVRELRRLAPDVVVLRGYNAEGLGRLAAVLARVPHVVVWVHNCGDLERRGRVRQLADAVLDRVTDAYFGVAQAQVPYLVRELGLPHRKVRIIHNGVDPSQFDGRADPVTKAGLGLLEDDLVVGIVAALRPEKDHETFLRAAALVAETEARARFLVVGDGQRRAGLEETARRLGIADRVVFAGARGDVASLLSVIDVFVLSSFTIECLPMALLEAMASSRPAVCTAVGGIPELLEDGVTGYLVPPRDPAALADKLIGLLGAEDERLAFGAAARARVEAEFTLERSVGEAQRQLLGIASPPRAGDAVRRPLRLALVLDETSVGGVELLMRDVFRAFDPAVVEPCLVSLRTPGPLAEEFRAAGFPVHVMGRSGKFDLRTLPRLVRTLRRGRTDAVLVTHHHRASLALGRLAARLARVPVTLVAVHDMDLTGVGGRVLPRWAAATLRETDALILLAPSQGEYLHREEGVGRRPWSRTREVVIPNGVTVGPLPDEAARAAARARLGLPVDAFVVGIVARLSAQKAHHVLFEAFAILRRSHPAARLVVVGGGPRERELRALATSLGLGDSVQFTGILRDVPTVLPAFDVSCLSSVHEGVPMAVIEAMASGIPVVATDCGALRDIVVDGEHGHLVPVGNAKALADRLGELAEDPRRRQRMGTAARRRVEERYRVEQTAHGYEELLVDLMTTR
ncbi:Glycosyltransferase involved in cell wall bisynthesis [Geodermatophilus pulveris]|uniref:Glycosyltransferase involved in cell wall bisynthesis n=1 Tax=Geodermatophilus pulveris TaxID=1564159 RepID=A0A239J984_9ACTN|nr:glycosyltransferase [Geodermatophilus pulveris]SNT02437.1 Glycosyltransferase involved in cell wall bisynthesis [Geodermatophilus pulveris]